MAWARKIVFLSKDRQLKTYIDGLAGTIFLLLDPSDIERFDVLQELQRPYSYCLLSGAAKEAAGASAPYLLEWGRLQSALVPHFLTYLEQGAGVVVTSQLEPERLKRRLKMFLYEDGDPDGIFQKFYLATNFEFFLRTNADFWRIFREINLAVYRQFYEPEDYVALTSEEG